MRCCWPGAVGFNIHAMQCCTSFLYLTMLLAALSHKLLIMLSVIFINIPSGSQVQRLAVRHWVDGGRWGVGDGPNTFEMCFAVRGYQTG